MKIAVAADGAEPLSKVAKRFGHSEYIQIFDTENNTYSYFENIKEHSHKDLEGIISSGVNTFIVGNIGPNSFFTIADFGCGIYLARNKMVDEAVKLFLNNKLQKLTEPTVKKSIGQSKNESHHENDGEHHNHKNHDAAAMRPINKE